MGSSRAGRKTCPQRTEQAALEHATRWPQRPKLFQSPLGPVSTLSAHRACSTGPGLPRFSLMRSGFAGFASIWFPLPSLPSTHIFFPFSFHVLLPSCSVISFRSFFCNTPALGMYARNLPSTQVLGRPGALTMSSGSLVVPVHLVSLSSQPHTLVLFCFLFTSSFFFPSRRGHTRICLPLSLLAHAGACGTFVTLVLPHAAKLRAREGRRA